VHFSGPEGFSGVDQKLEVWGGKLGMGERWEIRSHLNFEIGEGGGRKEECKVVMGFWGRRGSVEKN